jgi:hypothetical protein
MGVKFFTSIFFGFDRAIHIHEGTERVRYAGSRQLLSVLNGAGAIHRRIAHRRYSVRVESPDIFIDPTFVEQTSQVCRGCIARVPMVLFGHFQKDITINHRYQFQSSGTMVFFS